MGININDLQPHDSLLSNDEISEIENSIRDLSDAELRISGGGCYYHGKGKGDDDDDGGGCYGGCYGKGDDDD